MYVLGVAARPESTSGTERLTITQGPDSPAGQILLAGFVDQGEPLLQRHMRTVNHIVVSFVTEGRGLYRDDHATITITAPALTIVEPGHPHWYGTRPGEHWSEWFAIVNGPVFDAALATVPTPKSGPHSPAPGTRPDALAAILHPQPGSTVTSSRVWDLARWLADALTPTVDVASHQLEPALEALHDFDRPVDLHALARRCGLSYETFRRRFAREHGQAPLAYRNTERLRTAALLLRATDLDCSQISERLGYADQFHFSRRFKARYGQAPTHYRNTAHDPQTEPDPPLT